jgi:hypothetical protein
MSHHVIRVVMTDVLNISPNAAFAKSPFVGWRASCAMMISRPLSKLAMSVLSRSTCRNVMVRSSDMLRLCQIKVALVLIPGERSVRRLDARARPRRVRAPPATSRTRRPFV